MSPVMNARPNNRPLSFIIGIPNLVICAAIAGSIIIILKAAPIAAVLGITSMIAAASSSVPIRYLPHGSRPSFEKIYLDSFEPENLK